MGVGIVHVFPRVAITVGIDRSPLRRCLVVVDATSTPSGGSTDVGDVQHLQPVFTFNTGGAVGSGLHSVDFDVNDEELAYIVTAKIFALTAYRLLKGGAVAAKKLVDDYKPIFTKQEYIDFMESMISKKTGGAPVFEEE